MSVAPPADERHACPLTGRQLFRALLKCYTWPHESAWPTNGPVHCKEPQPKSLAIRDRALDFELQCSRTSKVGASDSPFLVGWWLECDRTPFDNCAEIPVAIITFKSQCCRSVSACSDSSIPRSSHR